MDRKPLMVLAALAAATAPDDALARFGDGVRDGFARDPMRSVLGTVLAASYLFYRVERGHNPKVTSFYDALIYVSTNLSVGYSDIFAKTPAGKMIGSALMTYGPAMAAKIFDPPSPKGAVDRDRAVEQKLDRIVEVLEAIRAAG